MRLPQTAKDKHRRELEARQASGIQSLAIDDFAAMRRYDVAVGGEMLARR